MSDPLVELARASIRAHLEGEPPPVHLVPDPRPPCGVFVSIHEPARESGVEGPLRGCVGMVAPSEPTVAAQVARVAVDAAIGDPRFPPLRPEELEQVEIEVHLLSEPEPVTDLSELEPSRYGVIVRGANGRIGLLLPGIVGIDSAREQIEIAAAKAGLAPWDPPEGVFRFTTATLR